MSDAHEAVPAALSWNSSAPGSVLLRLLQSGDRNVRRNIAARGDLPCSSSFTDTPSLRPGSKDAGALVGTPMCRTRRVPAIRPGLRAFTRMPSAAHRSAPSTANRTLAVLDWP